MCFSNCSEGDLQLDNSTSPPLVMMCVQRHWGYICGRQAPNSPWTQENVGVACQQDRVHLDMVLSIVQKVKKNLMLATYF